MPRYSPVLCSILEDSELLFVVSGAAMAHNPPPMKKPWLRKILNLIIKHHTPKPKSKPRRGKPSSFETWLRIQTRETGKQQGRNFINELRESRNRIYPTSYLAAVAILTSLLDIGAGKYDWG